MDTVKETKRKRKIFSISFKQALEEETLEKNPLKYTAI